MEKLKEGPNFLVSLLQLYTSSTSKLKFWFEKDFNSWKDWSFLKNRLFWSNQNSNVENRRVNGKLFSHTLYYIEDFYKKKKFSMIVLIKISDLICFQDRIRWTRSGFPEQYICDLHDPHANFKLFQWPACWPRSLCQSKNFRNSVNPIC